MLLSEKLLFISLFLRNRVKLFLSLALLLIPPPLLAESGESFAVHEQNLGLQYLGEGRFAEAVEALRKADLALEQAGKPMDRILILGAMAEGLERLGHWSQALNSYQEALLLARQGGDATALSPLLSGLGGVLARMGRLDEAETHLRQAVATATEGERASLALNNLGSLLALRQKNEEAQALFQQALTRAEEDGQADLASRALLNAMRLYLRQGEWARMEPLVDRVSDLLASLPPSPGKVVELVALGEMVREAGKARAGDHPWLSRSREILEQAVAEAERLLSAREISLALGHLGHFHEELGEKESAFSLTQRALFHAQEVMADDLLYQWQWQAGRLLVAMGQKSNALSSYRQAVRHLESVRQEVMGESSRENRTYREQVGSVYMGLADLLLNQARDAPLGGEALLLEAQQTLEFLKAAELEDYFRDQCVDTARASVKRAEQVSMGTALVYPVLLPDRTVVLLGLASGMRQFIVDVPGPKLKKEARDLRFNLEKRTSRSYLHQARNLYDWLIRPMEATLRENGVNTLVFVPDEELREIPLAALNNGQEHLLDRFAVAVVPGVNLTDPRPIQRSDMKILLTGLTEGVQGFAPLPFVAQELEEIQKQYQGLMLKDRDFSVVNMERELEGKAFRVVHIASHGQFTGDVANTFLLTHDGRLSMDGLDRLIRRSGEGEKPVELLTLSACQTAKGDDRAALGLAGVAIKAGAQSALATLWFINDQASSLLVNAFYRHLGETGKTKAQALREAQLELKQNRNYRHPAFWSPFLLIGNWL